ncbi:MAG: ATP-binding protein [Verrucomicrobiota bacterium]
MKHYADWSLKNAENSSFYFDILENQSVQVREIAFVPLVDTSLVKISVGKKGKFEDALFGNSLFRDLIDNIHDVVLITQAEPVEEPGPKILYFNNSFCEMTGFGQEALGETPRILQGVDTKEESTQKIRKALANWERVRVVLNNYKSNKEPFLVELDISPIKDKTGWWIYWVSIQRDITKSVETERKIIESEKERNFIVSSSDIGLWNLDLVSHKLSWDDSMYSLYDIKSEDFSGHYDAWKKTLHPDDKENVAQAMQEAISAGTKFDAVFRIIANNKVRYIKAIAEVVTNSNGQPIMMKGINFDITTERMREEKLKKANEELTQFAYRTSHDLRGPLVSSIGLLDIIEQDIAKKNFTNIDMSITHLQGSLTKLNDLVVDILNITKADLVENKVVEIDFEDFLQEVWNDVKSAYLDFNAKFIINSKIGTVKLYKTRVKQIIRNLLSNSIKYSSKERDCLIEVQATQEKGNMLIEVADNGVGIPEEFQSKVFDMFTRFDQRTVGSGLGMAIVKKHMDLLGGSIKLKSSAEGTSIFMKLPLI